MNKKDIFHFIDKNKPEGWKVYFEPHINGVTPDIIAISKTHGILIISIYLYDISVCEVDEYGMLDIEGEKERNPFTSIEFCHKTISDLYLFSQGEKEEDEKYMKIDKSYIHSKIIFPSANQDDISNLREKLLKKNRKPRIKIETDGNNISLDKELISRLFGNIKQIETPLDNDMFIDLQCWVGEPDYRIELKRKPEVFGKVKELIYTKGLAGRRRAKGSSGSGKSLLIAGRAAELIKQNPDLKILVLSFNITLRCYLEREFRKFGEHPSRITWSHFHHELQKLQCHPQIGSKRGKAAKELARDIDLEEDLFLDNSDDMEISKDYKPLTGHSLSLTITRPKHVLDSLKKLNQSELNQFREYDCILVDEAQDWYCYKNLEKKIETKEKVSWWDIIDYLAKEKSEMMIALDPSQNIYSRPLGPLSQTAKVGNNFRRWHTLETSYRLPHKMIKVLDNFIKKTEPVSDLTDEYIIPQYENEQMEMDNCQINIAFVEDQFDERVKDKKEKQKNRNLNLDLISETCFKALCKTISDKKSGAVSDLTFLTFSDDVGLKVVERLEKNKIHVAHTFGRKSYKGKSQRERKLEFYLLDPEVKATTIYSFKGYQAKFLVLFLPKASNEKYSPLSRKKLVFTALSRIKKSIDGSHLTIVTNYKDYYDFFSSFGPRTVNDITEEVKPSQEKLV